jgi:hypothetical protein
MQSLGIYGKPRTNDNVIKAWQNGVSARNHRHSLTCISQPNGRAELFSYDLKIGERTAAGAMVIADFTAPAKGFHSMTTSCHVNLAKCHAVRDGAIIMHPKVWECSPMSEIKPF